MRVDYSSFGSRPLQLLTTIITAIILCLYAHSSPATEYYVSATGGSDINGGSSSAPFKTIGAALRKAGAGDTVMIKPGTYREMLQLQRGGTDAKHLLSLRATGPKVEIKGSDVVTGWVNYYGAIWKKTNWITNSQQVFADGSPLTQIGSNCAFNTVSFEGKVLLPPKGRGVADMGGGTFYYDRSQRILYVRLPDGSSPNNHVIEASVRKVIIAPGAFDYVNLEGINFSHSNSTTDLGMMGMVNIFGKYWTVTNCTFNYGDFSGMNIIGEGHLIKNCAFNNNGDLGIVLSGSDNAHGWKTYADRPPQNIVLDGNETSFNNYRRFEPAWQAGGIKAAVSCNTVTVSNHRALSNYGVGIWFDIGCKNIR
ncbi:MAG: right-handed parallel beta-helix repeat-containing protein, partial [Smithellaceae bacterium]|nr:right-handed parallel beta-helix repeat-containing protein [Smithellaceae bacterium]